MVWGLVLQFTHATVCIFDPLAIWSQSGCCSSKYFLPTVLQAGRKTDRGNREFSFYQGDRPSSFPVYFIGWNEPQRRLGKWVSDIKDQKSVTGSHRGFISGAQHVAVQNKIGVLLARKKGQQLSILDIQEREPMVLAQVTTLEHNWKVRFQKGAGSCVWKEGDENWVQKRHISISLSQWPFQISGSIPTKPGQAM